MCLAAVTNHMKREGVEQQFNPDRSGFKHAAEGGPTTTPKAPCGLAEDKCAAEARWHHRRIDPVTFIYADAQSCWSFSCKVANGRMQRI